MPRYAGSKGCHNHYIFVATSLDWGLRTAGKEIVHALSRRKVWLASRSMPFQRDYEHGYVAGRGARCFVGDAIIGGPLTHASKEEKLLASQLGLTSFEYAIPLEAVQMWESEVPIRPLVGQLRFISNKRYYGHNLRQAAARIAAEDYDLVLGIAEAAPSRA
jgi:hypothetical protein